MGGVGEALNVETTTTYFMKRGPDFSVVCKTFSF